MEELPSELLEFIFSHLLVSSVGAVLLTSHRMRDVALSDHLWKKLCDLHFGGPKETKEEKHMSWFAFFAAKAKTFNSLPPSAKLNWIIKHGHYALLL